MKTRISVGSVFQTLFAHYAKLSAYICAFLTRPSAHLINNHLLCFLSPSLSRAWLSAQTASLWAHHTVLHEIIMRLQ